MLKWSYPGDHRIDRSKEKRGTASLHIADSLKHRTEAGGRIHPQIALRTHVPGGSAKRQERTVGTIIAPSPITDHRLIGSESPGVDERGSGGTEKDNAHCTAYVHPPCMMAHSH